MKVADLFAALSIRPDKRSFRKGREHLGRFVRGASRGTADVGAAVTGVTKRLAAMAAAFVGINEAFNQARKAINFDEALTDLQIASDGVMGSMESVRDRVLEVSDATGLAKETVLDGTQAFVALTGDGKTAAQSMELFAKVTKATGANMRDITGVAARLIQNMGIAPEQFEQAFSTLIRSGKAGAVELKEMASLFGELTPLSEKFAGGAGLSGLAKLSGALQLVMQGAGSAPEAATQLRSLFGAISGKAAGKLAKEGIEVFNKDGSLRQFDAIVGEIQEKDFRRDKLIEIFGRKEAVAAFESLVKVDGAWEDLTEQSLTANDVAEDYAVRQQSRAAKIQKAWNKVQNALAAVFDALLTIMIKLSEHMDLVLIGLGSLASAVLILKAGMIASAVASAAAWLLALAPFILLAAAIAAVYLIVEDLWAAFRGGDSVFKDLYNSARKWLRKARDEVDLFAEDLVLGLSGGSGIAAATRKKREEFKLRQRKGEEFEARVKAAQADAERRTRQLSPAQISERRLDVERAFARPFDPRAQARAREATIQLNFQSEVNVNEARDAEDVAHKATEQMRKVLEAETRKLQAQVSGG